MHPFNQVIPAPINYEQLRQQIEYLYVQWQAEYQAKQPEFKIENIRFEHDPQWRYRLMSIQNAHDGNSPFWRYTKIFCAVALGVI